MVTFWGIVSQGFNIWTLCVCVCVCAYRGEKLTKMSFSKVLRHLISLRQHHSLNLELTNLATLTGQKARTTSLHLPYAEIVDMCCLSWRIELRFSCFRSKHFADWAISPVLNIEIWRGCNLVLNAVATNLGCWRKESLLTSDVVLENLNLTLEPCPPHS